MKQPGLGSLSGAIAGPTPGRADMVPADVRPESFVIPADVVAAAGDGNNEAGYEMLAKVFKNGRARVIPRHRKASGGLVPIAVSHGEMLLEPEEVEAAGGPEVVRKFCDMIRKDWIAKLKELPKPR